MLSTLRLAQIKPVLLTVRLHCSIRGSELRASCVFLGAQPHAHMPRTFELLNASR